MSREEIILTVQRIIACEDTEEEIDAQIQHLESHVSDPSVSDYMFSKEYEGLTVEEIADKIIAFRPTRLGPY